MQCTAERKVVDLIIVEKNLSLEKAINGNQICQMQKAHGEPYVLKAFTGVIIMAAEFFNTTSQFNEAQAMQTAALIIEQYPHETFEDFILCLKNAKIGKYGTIYNRIDGQLVFTWFQKYLDEKYEKVEQIKNNEKFDYNAAPCKKVLSIAESFIESRKELTDKKPVLTEKTHFEKFCIAIKYMTVGELVALKNTYTKAEKTTPKHFTDYLNVIDNQLKTFV